MEYPIVIGDLGSLIAATQFKIMEKNMRKTWIRIALTINVISSDPISRFGISAKNPTV